MRSTNMKYIYCLALFGFGNFAMAPKLSLHPLVRKFAFDLKGADLKRGAMRNLFEVSIKNALIQPEKLHQKYYRTPFFNYSPVANILINSRFSMMGKVSGKYLGSELDLVIAQINLEFEKKFDERPIVLRPIPHQAHDVMLDFAPAQRLSPVILPANMYGFVSATQTAITLYAMLKYYDECVDLASSEYNTRDDMDPAKSCSDYIWSNRLNEPIEMEYKLTPEYYELEKMFVESKE